MENNNLGAQTHLIMDVVVKDSSIFNKYQESTILHYIEECVRISDMEKLDEIKTYLLPVPDSELVGITAFVPLSTSHLSLHSWPELNYISIDLFSCKDFEIRDIIDFTREYFNTERIDVLKAERHIGHSQFVYKWTEEN